MKIFRDNTLNKQFLKQGYVVVSLLSNEKVEAVKDFYKSNRPAQAAGFHTTHFFSDVDYKEKVQETIENACSGKLQELLIDYKALFSNFMVKEPGENSRMPLHADWTYVDESNFISLGVWCTLVDTNKENGMLGVVPYSHNLKANFRGPQIPTPFHDFNEYVIKNYGKLLPMQAGEAVIYNHKLLHFSPANQSNEVRLAFNSVWVPKETQVVHYTMLNNEIRKYKVNDKRFFICYSHFKEPQTLVVWEKVDERFNPISKSQIDSTLKPRRTFNLFNIIDLCLKKVHFRF